MKKKVLFGIIGVMIITIIIIVGILMNKGSSLINPLGEDVEPQIISIDPKEIALTFSEVPQEFTLNKDASGYKDEFYFEEDTMEKLLV